LFVTGAGFIAVDGCGKRNCPTQAKTGLEWGTLYVVVSAICEVPYVEYTVE
jgi:hypothetical protein